MRGCALRVTLSDPTAFQLNAVELAAGNADAVDLTSSGTLPNFFNTIALPKSPVAGSPGLEKRDCLSGAKRRLERRTRSSRGKCRPEHGQAANGRFLCRFVLDDVPVLGKLAVPEAHDIHHDPVRRQAHA